MDAIDLDPRFPLRDFIGLELDIPEPGHCVARIDANDKLMNPNGVVHGGVLFTMVDTAMGGATMSTVEPGQLCASVEIQTRFLRPAGAGTLVADTEIVKRGRRIAHLESHVRDADDNLVATATGTFAIFSVES